MCVAIGNSLRFITTGLMLSLPLILPVFSVQASQLTGKILTGHKALGAGQVTLYEAGNGGSPAIVLGSAESNLNGTFRISYESPAGENAVLYLVADMTPQVKLAAVPGVVSGTPHVVINERSTVATAYAMAQFIDGDSISGNKPGLANATSMLGNLVDISNGGVSPVLQNSPNGMETTAWADFNTLANMIARCIYNASDCTRLFELSASPGDGLPGDTLQAMENIAHNPAKNVTALLEYAQVFPLYRPALGPQDTAPDAWTLALRFTDRNKVLDGPGLIVFDRFGNAWVNNNYLNRKNPRLVCGDNHLLTFGPDGRELQGSPYGGGHHDGGLYGSGFGIAIDPFDDVWVSNFGFTGSECTINGTEELTELYRSISQFNGNGQAISPSTPAKTPPYGGWRSPEANISQPQGTASDTFGNIWIGNCGNASVTKLANGSIGSASNFMPVVDNQPVLSKPFGVTVDPDNRVWVASNNNDRIVAFNQDGSLYKVLADPFISLPMGVASDASGNIWIANSGAVRPPCAGDLDADRLSDADAVAESPIPGASVSVYLKDTGELHAPPFRGGGIFMPWGIAVDGNNDVWVANFAGRRSGLIGVTQLCGIGSPSCPAGQYGQPISPATGYTSNGLERITGVSIDASGNVWLANNWLRDIDLENPGGHQLVVFLGLAAPIKMPLIGPPESP